MSKAYFFTSPLLGKRGGFLIALVTLTSPSISKFGGIGLTDVPFVFITIIGIGCSILWRPRKHELLVVLFGGILIGFTFAIRNVAAATIFSLAAAQLLLMLYQPYEFIKKIQKFIAWGIGLCICIVPLLIRNYVVFGTIQPYKMQNSTVGLVENIRSFLHSTILDITGCYSCTPENSWNWIALGIFTLTIMIIGIFLYKKFTRNNETFENIKKNYLIVISLSLLVLFGAVLVIYARTKYQWGEMINMRHVMQYNWALLTLIVYFLNILNNNRTSISSALIIVIISCHLYYGYGTYSAIANEPLKSKIARNESYLSLIKKDLSNNNIVGSNYDDSLRILANLPIRSVRFEHKSDDKVELFRDVLLDLSKSGKIAILYIFFESVDKHIEMLDEVSSKVNVKYTRYDNNLLIIYIN